MLDKNVIIYNLIFF